MQASQILRSPGPAAVILIREMVDRVFLSEGIHKFFFPAVPGVRRFIKIGIPDPQFFRLFVDIVEMVCAAMLIIGLLTRVASFPLLGHQCSRCYRKASMLSETVLGGAMHEARTDSCRLPGQLLLLIADSDSASRDECLLRNHHKLEYPFRDAVIAITLVTWSLCQASPLCTTGFT